MSVVAGRAPISSPAALTRTGRRLVWVRARSRRCTMTDAENAFKVTLEPEPSSLRVVVAGELDIATASVLSPHVTGRDGGDAVVLDLAAVTFIDSTGLRLLIEAHAALGERLRIVPSPACERLFEITGVRDRLPIDGH